MPVTFIYAVLLAALFALIYVQRVKRWRRWYATGGAAYEHELKRAMRAQADFTEYAPIFLVLCAALEYLHFTHYVMYGLGAAFLVARALHAYSMLVLEGYEKRRQRTTPIWRQRGRLWTFYILGFMAIALVIQFLIHTFQ